jgi:hypothetical protein
MVARIISTYTCYGGKTETCTCTSTSTFTWTERIGNHFATVVVEAGMGPILGQHFWR